jgi:hypothetical protein
MHRCGRLTLIKTTLSLMPMYMLISLAFPIWLHKALEKLMKAFLWTRSNEVCAGKCLIAWGKIQKPLQVALASRTPSKWGSRFGYAVVMALMH